VKCKLPCVKFRRESDPRRAFRPAFGITGISDDGFRSAMRVIVISLRTPWSAGENVVCTWEYLGAPTTSLGVSTTSLGAPMTSLGAPTTSQGAPQITVKQSGKNIIFFENVTGAPVNDDRVKSEIHSEAVIKQVWRCTWRRYSSVLGDIQGGRDRVDLEMHSEIVIEQVWRCTWRPQSSELGGHN